MLSVTLLGLLMLMGNGNAQPVPSTDSPAKTEPSKERSRQLGPLPDSQPPPQDLPPSEAQPPSSSGLPADISPTQNADPTNSPIEPPPAVTNPAANQADVPSAADSQITLGELSAGVVPAPSQNPTTLQQLETSIPQKPRFKLAGVYDSSSVLGVKNEISRSFLWQSAQGMTDSCGPSKAPDAMGLFEAEAFANQMAPSLVILLEHNEAPVLKTPSGASCTQVEEGHCEPTPRPPINSNDVSIGIGAEKIDFKLQPMVKPRYLAINIDGFIDQEAEAPTEPAERAEQVGRIPTQPSATEVSPSATETELYDTSRYQKLIRTQLEIETCLEHKVGRAWLGNDSGRLRQAFLLDPPEGDRVDRKYFGAQRDPVPAYLAPPDACAQSSVEMPKDSLASKGEGELTLTPSDVWGASLRECDSATEAGGRTLMRAPREVSLNLTHTGIRQSRKQLPKWSALDVEVKATSPTEEGVTINVTLDGTVIPDLNEVKLFPEAGAMLDILAPIPHVYPTVGSKLDADRFVLLVVPNWQITEGLRRLFSRECMDDSEGQLCRCAVTDRRSTLPQLPEDMSSQTESVSAALDMLDARMGCLNIDGAVCQLSRQRPPQSDPTSSFDTPYKVNRVDLSPAEQCLLNQDIGASMPTNGAGFFDGVGWLLQNPEFLFVQVGTIDDPRLGFQIMDYLSLSDEDEGAEGKLPNLAGVTSGGFMGLQNWGYTVGQLSGRAPIVLPTADRKAWEISAEAQRSKQHSYFIAFTAILITFVVMGLRRVRDFWSPIPEERAYYWPGRQASNDVSAPEGVDLEDAAAEE